MNFCYAFGFLIHMKECMRNMGTALMKLCLIQSKLYLRNSPPSKIASIWSCTNKFGMKVILIVVQLLMWILFLNVCGRMHVKYVDRYLKFYVCTCTFCPTLKCLFLANVKMLVRSAKILFVAPLGQKKYFVAPLGKP